MEGMDLQTKDRRGDKNRQFFVKGFEGVSGKPYNQMGTPGDP
jgi:hypothetical protein